MPTFFEMRDDQSERVQYDFREYPIRVRAGGLSDWPGYAAPSHFHEDLEFTVVLSGAMQYYVNAEIVRLEAGDGIFVNARQLHYGFSEEKRECEFLCVLLHPMLLCSSQAFENAFVAPLLGSPQAAYRKLRESVPWEKEILRELKHIYAVKDCPTAPVKIQLSFLKIWDLLLDNLRPDSGEKHAPPVELTVLKNIVGFIQKNYAEKLLLADIAAAGAVGQSKCCKLFGKYFHQTPGAYLTQYRLNRSLPLLQDTSLSVTEIAYAVGFSGASYYAEVFHRWAGLSPTEYRRQRKDG